jgi:hypothetical protein
MTDRLNLTTGLLALCVAVAGCATSEEPLVDTTPAVAPASPTTADSVQPVANASPAPDPAAADEAEPPIAAVAQFVPPFPARELFEPPKRAQGTARRDDEHGETVELKGFVNVDEPKVVLSIDGVISPVPEGGEKYGVQVISIQPPSVVLQRGRNRWTATLE